MTPKELIKGTKVRTRYSNTSQEGVLEERVTQAGKPASSGRYGRVRFPDGEAIIVHWQLERIDSPTQPPKQELKAEVEAPKPETATLPAPAPAMCRPVKPPPWQNDVRVGAVFISQQPSGKFSISLVLTEPDGSTKNPVRASDLEPSDLEQEINLLATKVARHAASRGSR